MTVRLLWHERSARHHRAVMDGHGKYAGMTWGDLAARYRQPDWCNYPGALEGEMGCWSLTILPVRVDGPNYCQSCPMARHYDGSRDESVPVESEGSTQE